MIKIQFEPLAKGLYQLLKEHPTFKAIEYGMLPADFMESLSRMLKDKIPDCYHTTANGIESGTAQREELVRKLTCYFLEQATLEGFCHV